jgi:hypothetical protein
MKAFVFAAAGALALMAAAPANAASGYVGAAYQRAEVDTGAPGDNEVDGFGAEAAVAFNAAASLGLDLDAAYADSDDADSSVGATAHLYAKGAEYKFGGFAGIADVADETVWSVGIEGQHNFGQFVLAGAAGYANADDANIDAYGVDVMGSIFANDNLRFDAKVGWANLDAGAGDDDAVTAGVGAEWQLAAAPISFRASYAHTEFDTANVDADAFTLGVRYNWGGTLKQRNDDGPSFAGLSSLTSALSF